MARKKQSTESGKKPSTSASATIRIDGELAEKIEMICFVERISTSELVSPMIRDQINKRYALAVRKLQERIDSEQAN